MIVALNTLGIPLEDPRFVKAGLTLWDVLATYQVEDGSFEHIHGAGSNPIATEQAYYGLVSLARSLAGKESLYDMSDVALAGWTAPRVNEQPGDNNGVTIVIPGDQGKGKAGHAGVFGAPGIREPSREAA